MQSTPEPKVPPALSPIAPSGAVPPPASASARSPSVGGPTYRHRSRPPGASVKEVDPRSGVHGSSPGFDDTDSAGRELDQPGKKAPLDPAPYEIGHGRPPVHTRFKKGSSGNPKGRPKGAKNFSTLLSEQMNARQTVRINGREGSISNVEIMIQQMMKKAINGDHRAIQWAVNAYQTIQVVISAETGSVSSGVETALSSSELASLADYQREELRNSGVAEAQIEDILRSFGLSPAEVTP